MQPGRSGEMGEALSSLRTFYKLQSCLGRGRIAIYQSVMGPFFPTSSSKETQRPPYLTKVLGTNLKTLNWGLFVPWGGTVLLAAQESCSSWARLALRAGVPGVLSISQGRPPPWIAVLANKYLQLRTESCNSEPFSAPNMNGVKCYCNFLWLNFASLESLKIYQPYPFKSKVTLHQRWFPVYVLCSFNSQLTCLRIYM